MPADYYRDWLRVAAEEARHFELLREHLRSLSRDYGDFDAHDGLWTMVERTSQDVATSPSAITGIAGCASATDSIRCRPTTGWRGNIMRRGCAAPSMSRPGCLRDSRRSKWMH